MFLLLSQRRVLELTAPTHQPPDTLPPLSKIRLWSHSHNLVIGDHAPTES